MRIWPGCFIMLWACAQRPTPPNAAADASQLETCNAQPAQTCWAAATAALRECVPSEPLAIYKDQNCSLDEEYRISIADLDSVNQEVEGWTVSFEKQVNKELSLCAEFSQTRGPADTAELELVTGDDRFTAHWNGSEWQIECFDGSVHVLDPQKGGDCEASNWMGASLSETEDSLEMGLVGDEAPLFVCEGEPIVTGPPRNPKKGIAAAHAWDPATANGADPFRISWYYTWSLFPGQWQPHDPQLEFVNMWPCHGTAEYVVNSLGAGYNGYLLFLNEPGLTEQCHMSVDDAVDYYLMIRNALPNAKLIGPQTILRNQGDFAGFTRRWRDAVRQRTGAYPDVAGYGFHVYPFYSGSGRAEDVLADYCEALTDWGEVGTKELWVTEFGSENLSMSPADVRAEVAHMVNVFENGIGPCQVARYAYFTDRRVPLGNGTGPVPGVPQPGSAYFDLYWRRSATLSYAGEAYRDAANP